MKVGESERSIFKHVLLDKVAGKVGGVASQIIHRLGVSSIIYIDSCAGTGAPNRYSETSSPAIVAKHIRWLVGHGLAAHGYLIESDRLTFNLLRQWAGQELMDIANNLTLVWDDYRSSTAAAGLAQLNRDSVCFVYLDPNSAAQVELSKPLLASLPPLTTFLVTLGVNASGVKRSPDRQLWFERIKEILALVGRRHDAALVRLRGDSDQWAYLVSVVSDWRGDIEKLLVRLGHDWPLEWAWHNDGKLLPMAEELFMTRKELAVKRDQQQLKLFPL